MSLQYFQDKIKEKRKQTPFREFVMEIVSWISFNFYKNQGLISRYPVSDRVKYIVPVGTSEKNSFPKEIDERPFFEQFTELFREIEHEAVYHQTKSENCEYADSLLF